MNRFCTRLYLLAIGVFLAASPAWANDQNIVIGAGLGVYTFSKTDDARKGSTLFGGEDEIKSGGMSELYGEWYLLDDVGIGLRFMAIGAGRSYTGVGGEKLEQSVGISTTLITVTWVAAGSKDYTRFGVMGGYGPAEYKLSEKYTSSVDSSANYNDSWSASGNASLLGLYVDWGGESFGARFGANYLKTSFEDIEVPAGTLSVDGSGTALYFDLRWAFK